MRVAVDVTPLVGVRTGIGQAVGAVLDALRAQPTGPDAPRPAAAVPVVIPYALSRRARGHAGALPEGTRFPAWPARMLLRAWERSDGPTVDRWLDGAEVVHATNYLAPPSRHPVVVSVWDCTFVRSPELVSPAVRRIEPMLRRAMRRGAWVHTGSHFVASEILEYFGADLAGPDRVAVVAPGIPELHHGGAVEPEVQALLEKPFILALGTIEPRKNLDGLVRAFGLLAPQHPELHLVLAGPDGPGRRAVDLARAALPQRSAARIVFTGAVSDAVRTTLLESASVLAYPSVYEGFGFPILEAMRSGVPVVASLAGSIPEVAGDAAALVEPLDPDALAAALARVLTDDDHREELIARGRLRSAEFSWGETARGLTELYAKAIG
ncbi:MAG: glycosyltransferase [Actinomycetia bacterium]|nr:glycosyltransferase [Actinomycetes bacterium]